jgi:small subunit ribosomal protein S17
MAKTIVGIVTSNKTDKTIVVTAHVRKTHPLYRKQYTVTSKFMAHDEKNEAQPGDKVAIVETRPISARKRFALSEILERPELREDTLAAVKSDDSGKKPSKSKAVEEEEDKEAAS